METPSRGGNVSMRMARSWLGARVVGCVALVALACQPPGMSFAEAAADPSTTLKRAVEQHRSGETEAALRTIEPLVQGPLETHVNVLRGRWLRELGRLDSSRTVLNAGLAAAPPRDVASRLWQELAQVEIASGNLGAARAAQERAWEETTDSALAATLAFQLAEEFEKRSLFGEALVLYRTVWERWPTALEADSAFERSTKIERETGADRAEVESLLAHLVALRRGGRCETVLDLLPSVMGREDKSAAQERVLRQERASCQFGARRYTEASQSFAALVKELDGDAAIEAAIQGARARARAGDVPRGIKELGDVARKAPEPFATRARYLAALLLEDRDVPASRKLLERVAQQKADPSLAREAGWQLGWQAFQRDDFATMRRFLAPLTEGSLGDIEVQRARYWWAVASEATAPEESRATLLELAEEISLTYYGMLASERLGITPNLNRTLISQARLERPVPIEIQRARWLQAADLPELALDEITSWRLGGGLDREDRVVGATVLHELGRHFDASRLVIDGFGETLDRGIDPAWRAAWLAAYPRPYGETVRAAVSEFQFDAALVYAIMREESLYRPEVQSAAGARGLMQLITPTAKRIAQALGVNPFEPENLYRPEINVRFGTYYLKKLSGEFDGARQLVIAAYNAGPEAVNGWTARGGAEPLDRFVDSVPYNETRRYLRRVLRSYRVYQLLYPEPVGETAAAAVER